MSATVITSHAVATDYLLEARKCVQTVRDSTLPGAALYVTCNQILVELDGAIVGLQKAAK
jgi:hypothetical protein